MSAFTVRSDEYDSVSISRFFAYDFWPQCMHAINIATAQTVVSAGLNTKQDRVKIMTNTMRSRPIVEQIP